MEDSKSKIENTAYQNYCLSEIVHGYKISAIECLLTASTTLIIRITKAAVNVTSGLTDWLSGGRAGGTWLGSRDNYRAESLWADADRPSAGAGVGWLYYVHVSAVLIFATSE